jgi:hypothetical protein
MHWVLSLIEAHQIVSGTILMWIIGNAISAMPTPRDNGSMFYDWFFKFMQPIGGAIPRMLAIYAPSWLKAITGQETKSTVPPNPPVPAEDTGSPVATKGASKS